MKVLCFSGSRADYGGIEATYQALRRCDIDATLFRFDVDTVLKTNGYDLVVLLGDRSEILRFAVDFYLQKMPICHLSGGDVTEGSQDDCMRHAITKLSHLHFPTNEDSAKRIIQMGEEPWRVHVVGYPGVDNLEIGDHPGWLPKDDYFLVVWHPNTLVSEDEALQELKVLATALTKFDNEIVVIGPSNDAGGAKIAGFWQSEDALNELELLFRVYYESNLPRPNYLSLLKHAKCLVGNSSSGFYEAPSFGTPVVNIGDRQKGRELQPNILSAQLDIEDIVESIGLALALAPASIPTGNIYATGNAADKIAEVIANIKEPKKLLLKKFCDINYT